MKGVSVSCPRYLILKVTSSLRCVCEITVCSVVGVKESLPKKLLGDK